MRRVVSVKFIFVLILICQFYFFDFINGYAEEVNLGEETVENNNLGDYKVYVNNNEVYNYDLLDNSIVNFRQVYDGDMEECSYNSPLEFFVDYSKKLYGSYNYNFSLVCSNHVVSSKSVVINYVGDNNEIINSNGIYYNNGNYFILGNIENKFTKEDILSMFNQNLDEYNASLKIIDVNGAELVDGNIVESNYILRVSANYDEYNNVNYIEEEFIINIVYDVNNDDVIDNMDIKAMLIDLELDSYEELFDVKDIVGIDNNNDIVSSDKLTKFIEYEEEVNVYDLIEVKYYINGFNNDLLSGVKGEIKFDDEVLELIDIKIDNVYGNYNSSGKFLYLLDKYNKDGLFITFYFKTLNIGSSNIFLDNFELVTVGGDYVSIDNSLFSIDVTVGEYGKGGDVEDNIFDDRGNGNNDDKVQNLVSNKVVYEDLLPSKSVQYVALSNNNYIKDLKIKGYDIEFDKNVLEYNIKVDNDVSKLDLDIELSDEGAYYDVFGNDNFVVGNNVVSISVTSLDGSIRTYVINIEKQANYVLEELNEEKDLSRNIIIVLIIFIIIGLVYIILKDDEEVV